MGKKNKKGRGAEKMAQKLAKKEKKAEGMQDLEAMIAEFQEIDKKMTTFHEEKGCYPSPRCNLSVTAHPDKDELILFGGEYFNGHKTFIYNEVYVYNIKKNEWIKQHIPNPPPPRSAHQAVAISKEGGQLWVFGGEFASPNNSQFYHYKDLWVLHLKDHRWEQIKSSGGPSQRSGHRMILYKKSLFLFGGFQESRTNFVYFNDCYMFSLSDYSWTKLNPTGTGPSPRSACQLAVTPGGILVVGGYSKVKLKKEVEKGTAHGDMFLLSDESDAKTKWTSVKDTGTKPWPRSGFSLSQMTSNRSVLFGGVCDEEDEEDLESFFFNSIFCLDLVSFRWFPMELRKSKQHKKKQLPDEESATSSGGPTECEKEPNLSDAEASINTVMLPCPRMNSLTIIKHNTLFVYGGIFEEEEKQVTLNDLWSIDLKKMDTWKQLLEADDTSTDWFEENEDSSSENEQTSMERNPSVKENEDYSNFWLRTKEFWMEKASNEASEDERADVTHSKAENLAESWFSECG